MKLNEIILENEEEVIIDHERKKCAHCGEEVFVVMNFAAKKFLVELVGPAQWDVHKCQE